MADQFRNLVFEGGGVKGIAYVCAMEVLEGRGVLADIERVGGTSAGAINATLFAIGLSVAEQMELLRSMDFRDFMDDDFGVVRDTHRLINEFGWFKGDHFHDWIGDRLDDKFGYREVTFRDLEETGAPKLYVYGANLSTRFGEVFSAEHTPTERIADAVRISMSMPLFFATVRNARQDVYVDGGLLDNYPARLFDRRKYINEAEQDAMALARPYYEEENDAFLHAHRGSSPYVYNRQTLGFRLDSAREISVFRDRREPQHVVIDDFLDYARALIGTVLDSQGNQHLHGDDWQRTVYIDAVGVSATDFDLDDETKSKLVDSGRAGATKYFEWFDDENERPVNRAGT